MRLDKFLKISGIIKRRSVAQKIAELGGITKEGRPLKPSYDVKVGNILVIKQHSSIMKIRVTEIPTNNVGGNYFELIEFKHE